MRILLFLFLTFGIYAPANAAECSFSSEPVVVEKHISTSGPLLLLYWDFPSPDVLTNGITVTSNEFREYRASVSQVLNIDPFELLDRYAKLASNSADLKNLELVASKTVGKITPISCLESLLLDFQIKRNPVMLTAPTEFFAIYLTDGKTLRVYLLTNDSVGVSGMSKLVSEIDKNLQDGWRVIGNLHNHSFFLNDLAGNKPQGVLAPSATDVQLFNSQVQQWNLPTATITNGFQTVSIRSVEFPLLEAAE